MNRILVPSDGPDDWRRLTAKPELHWRTGFSARTVAHAWEAADGFPPEIASILEQAFGPTELLVAIPEHKTPLPGRGKRSQSDVFALARHSSGLVTCTVEGKVDEPFGETVEKWAAEASPGKTERLAYILRLLDLQECPGDIQYQLLHRTASALIEAERFAATDAAMIVHSFSPQNQWFDAFSSFVSLFGKRAEPGKAITIAMPSGRRLCLGWACGDERFRRA